MPIQPLSSRAQWLVVCFGLLMVPILAGTFVPPSQASGRFSGWIDEWDGLPLKRIEFTWRERAFKEAFPGQAAHFTDGQREFILRYTERPTRKLMPAADCLRAAGFKITGLKSYTDAKGRQWSLFEAVKFEETLRVSERVTDRRGHEWPQVSSWYWASTFGLSSGPWWAITMVERIESQ